MDREITRYLLTIHTYRIEIPTTDRPLFLIKGRRRELIQVIFLLYSAILEVHKKVVDQRDQYAQDCEQMRRSATPRLDNLCLYSWFYVQNF